MAGTPLGPHNMTMNWSQTNFGEIAAKRPVDQWHIDSVPYVCVLLLSDATDMVGGKLQVAMLGDPSGTIDRINAGLIDPSDIDFVNYPGPGYCIFMQGSRIAHSVTPVTYAKERRLTVVNSYQSLNPFDQDRTAYVSFRDIGADDQTLTYEFARHIAWRVRGQLDWMIQNAALFEQDGDIGKVLDGAAAELARARDLISRKIVDKRPYKAQEGVKHILVYFG